MIKSFFLLPTFIFILGGVIAQNQYPDKQFPADTPRLFAEGVVSDGLSNRDFTISPKGDEIFYTIQHPAFASSTILHMIKKMVNGQVLKLPLFPDVTVIWKQHLHQMDKHFIFHPTGHCMVILQTVLIYGK